MPLARAFADEGHDVAFATSASFAPRVEEAGFALLPAGIDQAQLEALFAPYRARAQAVPIPERRPYAFTWRFARFEAPAKVDALEAVVRSWCPELLVFEPGDLAAPLVGAVLGVPFVHHGFGRLVPPACFERAASEVAPLWERRGSAVPPLCGAFAGTYVDICPPSFQTVAPPSGTPVERLRPQFPAPTGETPPAWLADLVGRPLVYLTLGTVLNDMPLFRVLLDALAGLECTVLATIGHGNDPRALEPVPENAIVERYVPQAFVLEHATAVVSHGGSGSLLATFAHGLPSLLVPRGADQFDNAARCVELGAGIALLPDEVSEEAVRDAAGRLLAEPSYREGSLALAAEIEALPHPREVASRLAAAV